MKSDELAKLLGIPGLPNYTEQIEKQLKNVLATNNPHLREPALRLVTGGKRLRPFLVIAAAMSQGKAVNRVVIDACVAIELVHIGTLVHDDIIDEANMRWGVPTINTKEGVNNAILVGDYLLALAAVQATKVSKEATHIIASTIAEMCDGQSHETADKFNVDRTIESYLEAIRKKTAVLTSAACQIGAISANLPQKEVDALSRYGEAFGMAFQLTDDLLDFLSTEEEMGKPVGNDLKEGVYTMPILIAQRGVSRDKVWSWLGEKPTSKPTPEVVTETLISNGAIQATVAEIQKYNNIATNSLQIIDNNTIRDGLSKLPTIYLDWSLKKQKVYTLS